MWILWFFLTFLVSTVCIVIYVFIIVNQRFTYYNERMILKRQFMEWILQLVMPYLLIPLFLFFHTQLVGEELVSGEKIFYMVVVGLFGILMINSVSKSFLIWKEIKIIRTRRLE